MFLIGVISSIIAAVLQGLTYAITKNCQDAYRIYGFKMLIAEQLALASLFFGPSFYSDITNFLNGVL